MALTAERREVSAFEGFFRGHYPAVYRAVFLATGDASAAEDATQEAFERAYARWSRLSQHDWAGGWVMTTALNAARRSLRKRDVHALESAGRAESSSTSSLDVTAALRSLPNRQRQAVLLFYIGDLPVAAVANVMGVSEGTVKAHLSQARASIKHRLGAEYAG